MGAGACCLCVAVCACVHGGRSHARPLPATLWAAPSEQQQLPLQCPSQAKLLGCDTNGALANHPPPTHLVLASPKSQILRSHEAFSSRLLGLRSR